MPDGLSLRDTRPEPAGEIDPDTAIAVVGVSCRFPGARNPEEFWSLLIEGRSAIGDPRPDRRVADGSSTPAGPGGFLDDVAGFDAAFFSISPREAAAMDPQQRLMLELGWEALEDAGTVPGTLAGTRTGIWVGAIADDYAMIAGRPGMAAPTSHTFAGLQRGAIANRVSYLIGARGPSMTVDCGQSSSLVAVHLACESLRRDECRLALAGGVQLNLSPHVAERVSAFGALSPDGRCYVFDARANGFVRGEGGGLVVLKRLSQARSDGDRVYAVILGSATNNDGGGRTFATPDVHAQQDVLRLAWKAAGADPALAGYVELHGTGTPVGDPIEATALGAVLGTVRSADQELPVGSVKTNIGHLEGAAGIAGLIKTVISLEHGLLPPSLNFDRRHPGVPLSRLNLRVQDEPVPWPEGWRLAGVSSFGLGGTNCHVVLSGSGTSEREHATTTQGLHVGPWLIHARDGRALAAQAERLAAHVRAHPELSTTDIGFSLATRRSVFEHRAAVTAPDRPALLAALDAVASGAPAAGVISGVASRPREAVFVFPGQGAQWPLMARELLREHDAFAAAVRACARELDPLTGWSLMATLQGLPEAAPLDRVDVLQPVLFAVMVALARLWEAHGVTPTAVVGHSQGEVAAAHVAGGLSLADAARIVVARSRLVRRHLSGRGGMASVQLDGHALAELLDALGEDVVVAAYNGTDSTVVAGSDAALREAIAALTEAGISVRRIAVDYPSHTAAVDVLRAPLLAELADIRPTGATVPFYSALTGGRYDTARLNADYWYGNLREPVRFAEAVSALFLDGHDAFIEISPHPVLLGALRQAAVSAGRDVALVETLVRDKGGLARFHASLGAAHVSGIDIRWPEVWACSGARPVPLPTYAFQRRRHWLTERGEVRPHTGDDTDRTDGGGLAARLRGVTSAADRRNITERLVIDLAAVVLGHDDTAEIGAHHTFHDLGLDSSLAVRLSERVGMATGLPVTTRTLFENPTCALLARYLMERADAVSPSLDSTAGEPDGVMPALPPDVPAEPVESGPPSHPAGSYPSPAGRRALHDEPIAVVGLACRFPGADGPDAFWDLLRNGVDAVRPVPPGRWRMSGHDERAIDRAGLLDGGVEHFDAQFFGISRHEAMEMDPQQRCTLEVAWEALEDAGLANEALRGTRTGVFMGVTWHDFADRTARDTGSPSAYTATGRALNMIANRLSYALDLRGPSMIVDTACSSSLLAVHLACQSLRSGESVTAIAGGVNLLLSRATSAALKEFGGLSADGRCKTFDARADGYGRGEGCGVVVLKPLSAALADNDDIWCIIRGSAVINDGLSNGLTAPNPAAQEEVLLEACRRSGVEPADVHFVETHGTGTALGDEIETSVLGTVFGAGRARSPLLLGAVKTNIGHLEAAAGIAGLIKTALVLKHRQVPPNLHFETPNARIDFAGLGLRVPTRSEPWPQGSPLLAGVSSFGWGGTNVHLVLEGTGEAADSTPVADSTLITLTARSPQALRDLADQVSGAVAAMAGDVTVSEIAAATAQRAKLPYRLGVVADTTGRLVASLRAFGRGEAAPGVVVAEPPVHRKPKIEFLFPEDIGEHARAAGELLTTEPAFRTAAETCDRLFRSVSGRSVLEEFTTAADDSGTRWSVPAQFTAQVALVTLLRSWGITPDQAVGTGHGRIAAAYAAGAVTLPEAVRHVHTDQIPSRAFDAVAPGETPGPVRDAEVVLRMSWPPVVEDLRVPRTGVTVTRTAGGNVPMKECLLDAIAALFVLGAPVAPPVAVARRTVKLPHYPWQRTHYPISAENDDSSSTVPSRSDSRSSVNSADGKRHPPPAGGPIEDADLIRGVQETLAGVIELPPSAVEADQPLREMGMTSVMALDLANRWGARFGVRLTATTVWNHPTVRDVAALIKRKLGTRQISAEPVVESTDHRSPPNLPDPAAVAEGSSAPAENSDLEILLERELAALRRQMEVLSDQ